jgi:toxin FitB
MIVLDTNVVSELMRPAPNLGVLRWLDRQARSSIWITSVNVFELRFGLQTMPVGKRQAALNAWFEKWLVEVVQQRILAYDEAAARMASDVAAQRAKKGRPGELRDTMIAGIVLANHATLATRNIRHYEDIAKSVVNPWEQG